MTSNQPPTTKRLKVAIVTDWLVGTGGAERVVFELHRIFPDAPIYTSQYDSKPSIWHDGEWFADADVRTSWLQRLPLYLRKFLPVFRAWYFSHLDLSAYDLVISSSGAEAKGLKTSSGTVHLSYIHSPTHYYWIRYDEYLKNPGFGGLDPLARLGLKLLIGPLRKWDYKAAQRPDYLIANSTHTKNMIEKFYGRSSTVIHPPVDIDRFAGKNDEPRRGFVTAGRQTPYKRIDLAVSACTQLNLPLVVLGNGPDHKRLKRLAGKTITFLRGKDDKEVAHYFQTSVGFIFPNMDDFGIVAVEALAAGTPVIAYQAGGALDYVQAAKNGLFFKDQTVESLVEALKRFNPEGFNNSEVARSVAKFSVENFAAETRKFIDKHMEEKP